MNGPSSQPPSFLAHLEDNGRHQLVKDHLLSVAQIARTHSGKVGADVAGAAIGLLHDIGKYSGAFQHYLEQLAPTQDTEQLAPGRGTVDHSTAGAQTIWRRLRLQGPREAVVGEILALCVASHHSGLIDCITPNGADNLSKRMRKAVSESHYDEVWANAEASVRERSEQLLQDPQLVKGISDIITRICQTDKNENLRRFKVGLLVRFLFSCLIDADRTDTADSAKPASAALRQHGQYVQWSVLADLLERELERFSHSSAVDLLRKQVSDECLSASGRPKGIYTLTVPTGGGKTLASLRFALNHATKWGMDRVIYISPYTSIIDQNAEVVRQILEPVGTTFASVVLEHHSNLTPVEQTWRSKILSDNWDSPVVFTTAVQLLEALFGSRTRAVRRMHQMANAVLICDEIQTLPVRCVHIFNNAINFLGEQCGSSVVLCTATQPLLHLVDESKGAIQLSDDSEIMPDVSGLFSTLRRHITYDRRKAGGWEHGEAAALATSETERAGSCLVVVNTKREARSIFRECKALGRFPAVHLSTNMCPAHRLRRLKTMKSRLRRRAPVICVSTQLIEAGVDISFGSAIRALAGLDSIAQTAGRCNRHGGPTLGHVHVVNLKGDLPKTLTDIRIAQEAAQRVLDENVTGDRTIDLDDHKLIEQYFRYSFFEHRQEMDYPVGPDKAERDDTLLNMLGENQTAVFSCKPHPQIYMHQAFMTAANAFQTIDRVAQGVIVPYTSAGEAVISDLCAAHEPEKQFELLRRAQRFTVNLFPNVLRKLQTDGALHEVQEGAGILYLEKAYYNNEFGLNEEGTEEMEVAFG
ncbi:MAG: CRISPR-associated helicase Cas3' [Acidobacteriia bacterium]|nr:CRISPR-associated helicase Cas3' [Terriglobia bacterium]